MGTETVCRTGIVRLQSHYFLEFFYLGSVRYLFLCISMHCSACFAVLEPSHRTRALQPNLDSCAKMEETKALFEAVNAKG